ncbi:hypothetical protein [Metasolibacillus fluoroglycofenilyticus]|uniref:hypothetical protein n=1 Tax=Metasolibacillus fluoroglycofenilyticus TaxID=1239396 RepID=UPI000D3BE5FB|nr:hypothetical protein [Metasolibacillus fluoroglycofenilyticus]
MFYVIGQSSGKVYAQGTKADCMRELQKKYPSCSAYSRLDGRERTTLPEPMKLVFYHNILQVQEGEPLCQHLYSAL